MFAPLSPVGVGLASLRWPVSFKRSPRPSTYSCLFASRAPGVQRNFDLVAETDSFIILSLLAGPRFANSCKPAQLRNKFLSVRIAFGRYFWYIPTD